jgi:hypothetical protein
MRATTVPRILLSSQRPDVRTLYCEAQGSVVEVPPRRRSIRCGERGGKDRRVKDRRPR